MLLRLTAFLLFGLVRLMMAYGATRGGAERTVMARHVSGDPADDRAFQTSLGISRHRRAGERQDRYTTRKHRFHQYLHRCYCCRR
jgi:hypothetical protein